LEGVGGRDAWGKLAKTLRTTKRQIRLEKEETLKEIKKIK